MTCVAHLHPLTNIPTKYQLPTQYTFVDSQKIIKVKVIMARSNQGRIMDLAHLKIKIKSVYEYEYFIYKEKEQEKDFKNTWKKFSKLFD